MTDKHTPQRVSAALAARVLGYLTLKAHNGIADIRQSQIARETGFSEASVCFAVYHLEAAGLIAAERYRGGIRYRMATTPS